MVFELWITCEMLSVACVRGCVSDTIECLLCELFFFQAEDGIRDLVRSRGLGDVYKRQDLSLGCGLPTEFAGIKKGDTVIDLGSGAGNDVFLSLIHI